MLLKSIKLKNIRSYLDDELYFQPGSTLLSGDIGSGKSTVLMALDFALFGTRRGELDGSDLLRHGADSGSVELEFELDSNVVSIKRAIKRTKNGFSQESGFIEVNGKKEHKSASELRATVIELLGYPKEFVTKNPVIFSYTIYTQQDQMKRIFLNPAERLNTIRKIFGIDRYGMMKENAKFLLTDMRAMKRGLESGLSDMDAKKSELSMKEEQKFRTAAALAEARNQLAMLERKMLSLRSERESFSKDSEVLHSLQKRKLSAESAKKIRQSSIESNKKRISELEIILEKNRNMLSVLFEKPSDMNESDVKDMIALLEKEIRSNIEKCSVHAQERKKFESILRNGFCEFCGQHVSDAGSFEDRIAKSEHMLSECSRSIEKNEAEIRELRSLHEKIVRYSAEFRNRQVIERNLEALENQKESLERDILSAIGEISSLEEELSSLEREFQKYSGLEEKKNAIEREIDLLSHELVAASSTVSRMDQQVQDIEISMENLKTQIAQREKERVIAVHIGELVEWISSCFLDAVDEIEKSVLARIQEEFNEFFQKWFQMLMTDELLSVRIDEQFTPMIEQNGYETAYDNLSGGEKTAVALAYRLALNKVINSMISTIKTRDLIILDEPTDGFSSEQLDRMRDVLVELGLKQTIIVSHEPKIDSFVDNVIRLYKEEHVSRTK